MEYEHPYMQGDLHKKFVEDLEKALALEEIKSFNRSLHGK
jgi:hypothetical protein